jgi:hypothetical protein
MVRQHNISKAEKLKFIKQIVFDEKTEPYHRPTSYTVVIDDDKVTIKVVGTKEPSETLCMNLKNYEEVFKPLLHPDDVLFVVMYKTDLANTPIVEDQDPYGNCFEWVEQKNYDSDVPQPSKEVNPLKAPVIKSTVRHADLETVETAKDLVSIVDTRLPKEPAPVIQLEPEKKTSGKLSEYYPVARNGINQ